MIFIIIPVHNRIEFTKNIIQCLEAQTLVDSIKIIVINDQSTDDTENYLASRTNIINIKTQKELWWGGSVSIALDFLQPIIENDDGILLLNNDTLVEHDYIEKIKCKSDADQRAVIGSIVFDDNKNLISIGPKANISNLTIWDIINNVENLNDFKKNGFANVDFLPGRGTYYPGRSLLNIDYSFIKKIPHYYSDYLMSYKVAEKGYRLLVFSDIGVISTDLFGNKRKINNILNKYLAVWSIDNIFHRVFFYSNIGSDYEKKSAFFRVYSSKFYKLYHIYIYPTLYKIKIESISKCQIFVKYIMPKIIRKFLYPYYFLRNIIQSCFKIILRFFKLLKKINK